MASSSLPPISRTSPDTAITCAKYGMSVPLRSWVAWWLRAYCSARS